MSGSFERERLYCGDGECLEDAVVVGHAIFQANPLAGPPGTELLHTFTFPLCHQHAQLLRMDNKLVKFDNGVRNRDEV